MAVMRNTEIFERAMAEVFGQGNLEAVERFFASDFQEHKEGPGKDRGREGSKTSSAPSGAPSPTYGSPWRRSARTATRPWARVTFSGTNTGELMGHPPTGREATWTALDQCRYADGKLAEHWGVVDLLSMMQQIGIVPPPEQA